MLHTPHTSGFGDGPIKVAVAGAGFVTPFHIAGWQALEGVEVVAICALDKTRVEARAREHRVAKVYTSVEVMLDAEQPNVIDICTPAETHASLLALAAERGVHAMCQKPLAPTLAEARSIAREVTGIRCMVHENFRFRPWYREIKRQLDGDRVGELFYFRSDGRMASTVLTAAHPDVPYSIKRQPYFGRANPLLLLESAIHQVDTARFLLGEPGWVFARARRISPQVAGEDLVILHLGFPGVEAVIERSYASRGYGDPMVTESVAVEGMRGTIFLERDGTVRTEVDAPGERCTEHAAFDTKAAYPQSYAASIAHFVSCLREGRRFETDFDDNLKTLEVVFAAYRSIELGEVVRLPFDGANTPAARLESTGSV